MNRPITIPDVLYLVPHARLNHNHPNAATFIYLENKIARRILLLQGVCRFGFRGEGGFPGRPFVDEAEADGE